MAAAAPILIRLLGSDISSSSSGSGDLSSSSSSSSGADGSGNWSSSSSTGSAWHGGGDLPDDLNGNNHIWLYFLSLIIIILVHRSVTEKWTIAWHSTFMGALFNRMGVPRIIGDICAGCLLGPTLMGTSANAWLFPPENRPIVNMFGQFGLIMTSMSAGFSFDRRVLRGRAAKVSFYSLLNMAIPALISALLFNMLPETDQWRGSNFNASAYFVLIICAMSSSALPMVFLILDELKVHNDLSRFAIGLSCLSTIGLFTLLSVVVVLADSAEHTSLLIVSRLLLLLLIFLVLGALQWLWNSVVTQGQKGQLLYLKYGSDDMAILVIALGLLAAIATERLGYTFLLGAFLAGAAVPFDVGLRSNLGEKIKWMTRWIFLPQFFVTAGLGFDLRQMRGDSVPYVILFLALAFLAKALLVPISHVLLGIEWKEAAFCASLANCRGFNALIVAQVGQQYGLIGDSFFITCILLSIFSTLVTGPLARGFRPHVDPRVGAPPATATARTGLKAGGGGGGAGGPAARGAGAPKPTARIHAPSARHQAKPRSAASRLLDPSGGGDSVDAERKADLRAAGMDIDASLDSDTSYGPSASSVGPSVRLVLPHDIDASYMDHSHGGGGGGGSGSNGSSAGMGSGPLRSNGYASIDDSPDGFGDLDDSGGGGGGGADSGSPEGLAFSALAASPSFPQASSSGAAVDPIDREIFFDSWLSSDASARDQVLIVFAHELIARIRDPTVFPSGDESSGELQFRGDMLVDALCLWYHLAHRSTAVHLGQKMLEASVITPIDTPVFLDKARAHYALG